MAYKDKKAQAANSRKWYEAHRDQTLARTAARKAALREANTPAPDSNSATKIPTTQPVDMTYPNCSRCGKSSVDVKPRLDPYQHDVEGVEIVRLLCDFCEDDIAGDI